MIELVKGRELIENDVVQVYRNLHKGSSFSVRNKKSGLVVGIGDRFLLSNVKCVVREGGRQKVLQEKRKNVHAFIVGEFIEDEPLLLGKRLIELYYNPYTLDCFINKETSERVDSCDYVYFSDSKAWLVTK